MNIDPRGFKRGRCLTDKCDCHIYERATQGARCTYCECPAPKHEKLDDDTSSSTDDASTSRDECILPTDDNDMIIALENAACVPQTTYFQKDTQIVEVIKPVSEVEKFLPKKFTKEVEVALAKRQLTATLRSRIVRAIADCCYGNDATSSIIDIVADKAVERWPPLRSEFGHPSKALSSSIKKRMSKLRSHSRKSVSTDIITVDEFAVSDMRTEIQKENFSTTKLKHLLTAVRQKRKADANNMSAAEHIKIYPALKLPELLLWEFTQLTDTPENLMRSRWSNFLKKLGAFLKHTENTYINTDSHHEATLKILQMLPRLVPAGKRTDERVKYVLEVFEEDSPVSQVVPDISNPPRLIVHNATLMCYVDQTPIFMVQSAVTAVLYLIATYWVFNIEFPVEARPSFLLLATVLLQKKTKMKQLQKCSSVQNLLSQLKLND